jgi:prepilin-type N-terminal cleavage/methylation domain-containing protein
MEKTSKAFTLIELMIVMAVIAGLSVLGIVAIIQFRQGVRINNAVFEFNSIFQTMSNKARNAASISGQAGVAPDYYVLELLDSSFQVKSCQRTAIANAVVCSNHEQILEPADIDWYTGIANPCRSIGFERRTADIVFIQPTGTILNSGECIIFITLKENSIEKNENLIKKYTFNAGNDTYVVE